MIYFDDELPPVVKPPRTKFQKWARRFFILGGIILFFSWLGLYVLSAIGGNNPALRTGIENYLHSVSGYDVNVRQFNSLTFYPVLAVDIADIEFSRGKINSAFAAPGPAVMTAGAVKISMNFWDMFFHRGRLKTMQIDDLDLGNVLGLARPVLLKHIILEKSNGGDAGKLHLTGMFGGDPFDATQELGFQPTRDNAGGFFAQKSPAAISFFTPFLTLKGDLTTASNGTAHISLRGILTAQTNLTGRLDWRPDGRLDGKIMHGASSLKFTKIKGRPPVLEKPLLQAADIPAFRALTAALQNVDPALLTNLPATIKPGAMSK